MNNILISNDDQSTALFGTGVSIYVPTTVEPTVAVSTRAHMAFARGVASKRTWTSGPRRT